MHMSSNNPPMVKLWSTYTKANTGYQMRLALVFERALRTCGRTDRQMHERTDRQMDGQMQMGGRTNGWMDRPSYRDVKAQLKSKSSLQRGKK